MSPNRTPAQERWHLDKSVNVSVIIVLIGYAVLATWFGAKLDSRVDSNKESQDAIDKRVATLEAAKAADHEMLVRIDERTQTMAADIATLKRGPNPPRAQ